MTGPLIHSHQIPFLNKAQNLWIFDFLKLIQSRMETISSLIKYLSFPSLSNWYWSCHDIGTSTKIDSLFIFFLLVPNLSTQEIWVISLGNFQRITSLNQTVYLVPRLSLDLCGCIWLSIIPVQPSAWNISAFQYVCAALNSCVPLSSSSLYCINAGGGICLQIYLISLRVQQQTENVKKTNKRWVDGGHGGLTPTYFSGMLQLGGRFDLGLSGMSIKILPNSKLFPLVENTTSKKVNKLKWFYVMVSNVTPLSFSSDVWKDTRGQANAFGASRGRANMQSVFFFPQNHAFSFSFSLLSYSCPASPFASFTWPLFSRMIPPCEPSSVQVSTPGSSGSAFLA